MSSSAELPVRLPKFLPVPSRFAAALPGALYHDDGHTVLA